MDITIHPGRLRGNVQAIASKSMAHRLLIMAAFADGPTDLLLNKTNQDIEATAQCLRALSADIMSSDFGYHVEPVKSIPGEAVLPCRESGSTLRFMLPIVGALGVKGTFLLEGRLPERPLSPLWEEMVRMGCNLSRPTQDSILCTGKLVPGAYTIQGNVSSQFISGLLFAHSLMDATSTLEITGPVESAPYIQMTRDAISVFGPDKHTPGTIAVEGDWSNGAFFLAAASLGSDINVLGLNPDSHQGDSAVSELLVRLNENCTISAANIPDLIPILSVVAAANKGACFTDIQRLRAKESDRVASVVSMIQNLGGKAESTHSSLTIHPGKPTGGIVNSFNDHRIAMSAAIAATICEKEVTILDAQCVSKSYPSFWEEYDRLGGQYEQYLR